MTEAAAGEYPLRLKHDQAYQTVSQMLFTVIVRPGRAFT